jgi:energy-coupling factor transporter ATP-binding protein EcfA2
MLSQGQRRKLGFAISMAFRDFVSMVGNFKINFLSMDEVLDISTDDTAMREMLDIVRDMADEIGCALIITHRGTTVADKFDYRITVENDGIYSTLGGLEKL